ncbi:MAG TPA: TonB family protein [Candidatus Angelobacter sp.]
MQTVIFEERDKLSGAILLSVGLHLALVLAAILIGGLNLSRGQAWGGPTSGSAVQANIVSVVPLPRHQEPTENILANDSKGLTQSVPQKVQQEPDAIPIPDKNVQRKQQKAAVTQAPDVRHPITPPQNNAVPYGQGGQINVSYGSFTIGNIRGGFTFEGDFGTRFAFYVDQIQRKIYEAWHPGEIGPGAQGHRAHISFDISKDGTPSNIRVEVSSSIPALDQSAYRALQRIDTFGPLPQGYSGSNLHVELIFEPPR